VRYAIFLVALVGCIGNDLPEGSFGTMSTAPTVHFSRSTTGLTNYGGTGFYQWFVILSTGDGCAGDTAATFEINSALTGPNAFPTGVIPIRAEQVPTIVPSALVTADAATGVSGSITISSVSGQGAGTRVDGSADMTLTTGPATASFIAYTCQ
jgi:hypothetical protein